MIKDIAHVCLLAKDLPAVERFYCEGLGFRKAFDFLRQGQVIGFYLEVKPGRYIEIFRRGDAGYQEHQVIQHLCLEVSDLDAVCGRLRSRGIPVTEKAFGADRSWQAWTADPSGVKIEFHEYTAGSSQVTGENCVLG